MPRVARPALFLVTVDAKDGKSRSVFLMRTEEKARERFKALQNGTDHGTVRLFKGALLETTYSEALDG